MPAGPVYSPTNSASRQEGTANMWGPTVNIQYCKHEVMGTLEDA